MSGDLDDAVVQRWLGARAARSYPALLSTEAAAMAWARQGAPAGAVVVADYQASPRGRGGLPWTVQPGRGLGFTLLDRPELDLEREGWPYVAALLGLRDALAVADAVLEWPDSVRTPAGAALAQLGVYVEPGPARIEWITITALVVDAEPPRGPLLARLVQSIETRLGQPAADVLAEYLPACSTLGRDVRARLIPMGPGGPEVTGEAVDVLADGALVLLNARGRRVAVPPHNLGLLEEPQGPATAPDHLYGRRE